MLRRPLVLVLLAALSPAAAAWTLPEVVALGLKKGRVPRRLRSELRAAESLFGKTGARFLPRLSLLMGERGRKELRATQRLSDVTRATVSAVDPASEADGDVYSFELFLPVFRTQALELKTAQYNWRATQRRNHQAMEDYKLDVARRFYDLLRAQSISAIRRRTVERWEGSLELAKFRAEIGVRSRLDFWNTKVGKGNAETALIRAEVAEKDAADRLANLLGVDFEAARAAKEELVFEAFVAPDTAGWRRADLEARRFEARLARESLRAARLARRPDINLTLGTRKVAGLARDDSAALRYDFQFGRREEDHDWRVAKQAQIRADIQVEALDADITQERRAVARSLEATRRSIEVAKENLELAELSYEASNVQFEGGKITQIELQRSQDNLTEAERAYESLLIDYRLAGYRWRRAHGGVLFE